MSAFRLYIIPIHIILLFIILPASAQQSNELIDLYHGSELNLSKDIIVPQIFGHDENGYYAYTFDYKPAIERLDKQYQLIQREDLNLKKLIQRKELLGLCHFHDTIYMFTTEERLKRMLLFVETINKETLERNNDVRLLMNIPNQAGWKSEFSFQLSRQHDKLLVYSKLNALSNFVQDLHLMLYGEDFNLEWEMKEKIIYSRNPPRKSIIKVSDDGDVFFISLLDEPNMQHLRRSFTNRYHLVAATENGQIVNTYTLSLPELYISSVQIEPGDNHLLVCTGFYSHSRFPGLANGIFFFELDNRSGNFFNLAYYKFERTVLKEAIAENKKNDSEELFEFRIKNLIRRNNGDFIMLAENQYDQHYDTYQNIIATCFSPGGILNWTRVIQKRQNIDLDSEFNYSSYCVHAPKFTDKIYIIFNESDKNEFLSPGVRRKSFYPYEKANLRLISMGPSGEMSSSIIYRKTKKRMKTPMPLQYYDKLNNEMVIPLLYLKNYNYLNISFKE